MTEKPLPFGAERLTGAFAHAIMALGALAAGAFFFRKAFGSNSNKAEKHHGNKH